MVAMIDFVALSSIKASAVQHASMVDMKITLTTMWISYASAVVPCWRDPYVWEQTKGEAFRILDSCAHYALTQRCARLKHNGMTGRPGTAPLTR